MWAKEWEDRVLNRMGRKLRKDSGLRAEPDTAWLWSGRLHKLSDGFEKRFDMAIMACYGTLKLGNFLSQHSVTPQHFPQFHECSHHIDAHTHSTFGV
jgi:hypothetical protein